MKKIAFVCNQTPHSQEALEQLTARYGSCEPGSADVIVALGGDGLMLETLHRFMDTGIPIFGMHRGSIGFLMNEYREEDLFERLEKAVSSKIRPLVMTATHEDGTVQTEIAVNEVSVWRQTHQAAKLKISIDGQTRLDELICDGILVATPAGSTAYNLSAHGPILPINAPLLALTPISPFRPRRWRGALLPHQVRVAIDVLEPERRSVSATADNKEIRSIIRVEAAVSENLRSIILFDPAHSWDERILTEQFRY